ncbi:metalloregulator ArsR/SmtB family transcription factor [Telmatospirillum sp.]|uniref:ArsR/SmtB family transcription factor n=1 Tax=Telmatospirillum sp. TaxID=2079197 RepID=UPI0028447825|nr:metalloregulator ArsR/SmtB family transcription factor [Telmatospirillum sp.]MDR3435816.1 metalloregulator ArsR/SmtB family transcription factor [Telmatospirillum sp.]
MDVVLAAMRAAAEPSRFRLLALCAQGDLTVSEMVEIVGQSQPGVSRHLKLLCDAGLLERYREGAWVFYRLAARATASQLVRQALDLVSPKDPILCRDNARLATIKRSHAAAAAVYFRNNASRWAELRSLHIDEAEVEAAMEAALGDQRVEALLDIGTGTGRILELLASRATVAEGIDASREMLAVARSRIEAADLRNCLVRLGDMYRLPFNDASFDLVTIHQVLHFSEDPAAAVVEAARVLRPGGRLVVVDFAPHDLESLRQEHNHRRLGFADQEVIDWCRQAGLIDDPVRHLPGRPLTVTLWLAHRAAAGELAVPAKSIVFSVERGDA